MPRQSPVAGNSDFVAALGTASDEAIAQRFGVSASTVTNYRQRLKIPAWRSVAKGDQIEALLDVGGLSDSEIARRVGVDAKAVWKRRRARKVASPYTARAAARKQIVAAYLAKHPEASTRTIARETGISKSVVGTIVKELR